MNYVRLLFRILWDSQRFQVNSFTKVGDDFLELITCETNIMELILKDYHMQQYRDHKSIEDNMFSYNF